MLNKKTFKWLRCKYKSYEFQFFQIILKSFHFPNQKEQHSTNVILNAECNSSEHLKGFDIKLLNYLFC